MLSNNNVQRIIIVAGEESGDQLGEGLVKTLKLRYPNAIIEGIAGYRMQKEGCKSLFKMETLSVMGLFEVVRNLPSILKVRQGLIKYCLKNKPDIYIGIDAPDFNLPVELKLKKQGVKTVHYVSPSVWAWREGRVKTIKKATNLILSILPFEEDFYKKHNHKSIFVGHPLANKIPLDIDINSARKSLDIDESVLNIAILPGSRKQELERLLPIFLEASKIIKKKYPNVFFTIPVAKQSLYEVINKYKKDIDFLNIKIIDKNAGLVLQASNFVIVTSGTATLETMLYKKPMVMAYKLSNLSFKIAKLVIKTDKFSLPNILANKNLIPELIQDDANAENIAFHILNYIENKALSNNLIKDFYELHKLMQLDSNKIAANAIQELLNN